MRAGWILWRKLFFGLQHTTVVFGVWGSDHLGHPSQIHDQSSWQYKDLPTCNQQHGRPRGVRNLKLVWDFWSWKYYGSNEALKHCNLHPYGIHDIELWIIANPPTCLMAMQWVERGWQGTTTRSTNKTKSITNQKDMQSSFNNPYIFMIYLPAFPTPPSIPNNGSMFPRCSQRRSSRVKRTSLRCFQVGQESQEKLWFFTGGWELQIPMHPCMVY